MAHYQRTASTITSDGNGKPAKADRGRGAERWRRVSWRQSRRFDAAMANAAEPATAPPKVGCVALLVSSMMLDGEERSRSQGRGHGSIHARCSRPDLYQLSAGRRQLPCELAV